jgi:hypothetical protein
MAALLTPLLADASIAIGLIFAVIGGLWSLVVAAKRSFLWLLAVLIVPFAQLILLIVEPKARLPFVASVLGTVLIITGFFGADPKAFATESFVGRFLVKDKPKTEMAVESELPPAAHVETLDEKKARIQKWQSALEVKKAALKPGDATAKAEFDRELQEYLTELDKVKAEIATEPKR